MTEPRATTRDTPFFPGTSWTPTLAEAFRAALAHLQGMTAEEVFQASVQAGIYTPDGQLRPPYADDPEDATAEGQEDVRSSVL